MHATLHEYFAAIGLPATDRRGLAERLRELRKHARAHRFADGTMLLGWRDPSGSAVSTFIDDEGGIVGALPYYASTRTSTVYVQAIEPDAHFGFYDRLRVSLAPDDRARAFSVHAHDLLLARDRVQVGKRITISLTALADQWLRISPDPEPASEPGPEPPPSRIPALHHLRGRITRVDEPINRTTHQPFQHARLDTGEILLDLVVPEPDPQDPSTRLTPNTFVEGELLLVATVDTAPLDATMAKIRLDR